MFGAPVAFCMQKILTAIFRHDPIPEGCSFAGGL